MRRPRFRIRVLMVAVVAVGFVLVPGLLVWLIGVLPAPHLVSNVCIPDSGPSFFPGLNFSGANDRPDQILSGPVEAWRSN
jgi:hypothetical protein